LVDAVSGDVVATDSDAGEESSAAVLASRIGERLRTKLGVARASAVEADEARALLPDSAEAQKLYAEGLTAMRWLDMSTARDRLERAIDIAPLFALAHAALSRVWLALGYDARSTAEAKRAFELSASLPREQKLAIEARYREATKDYAQASEIYRALMRFFPDDADYGVRLVDAQVVASAGAEALRTVEMLRAMPSHRNDPRMDLAEALAAGATGDDARMKVAAERAAEVATARGARRLVAQARLLEATALVKRAEGPLATREAEAAKAIFDELGDVWGAARAMNVLATIQAERGDLEGAKRTYEECLVITRSIGDRRTWITVLNEVAAIFQLQGQLASAKERYEESLKIAREVGDKAGQSFALYSIATVLRDTADFAESDVRYAEARALAKELNDARAIVRIDGALSFMVAERGDLALARKMEEDALAMARAAGDGRGIAASLHALGETMLAEGDLATARARLEEALALRRAAGLDLSATSCGLTLATVAMEEGKFAEADVLARKAAADFASAHAVAAEGYAYLVLARSLLEQGKLEEATRVIERATAMLGKIENQRVRLYAIMVWALVEGASKESPRVDAAVRAMAPVAAEAQDSGAVRPFFWSQYALGRIEKENGLRGGPTRLATLRRDAAKRHFGLMVSKSTAVLAGPR
jgi:tetratricopeptide (TPR) repeat protein